MEVQTQFSDKNKQQKMKRKKRHCKKILQKQIYN